MESTGKRRAVRRRARSIKKANKPKMQARDYLQRTLVVLIIGVILVLAYFLTR